MTLCMLGCDKPGLEQEIDALLDHEVVKGILHQGCEVDEYAEEVEAKLRDVELESIQDYITESDTLVELHDQVLRHTELYSAAACLQGNRDQHMNYVDRVVSYGIL